MAQRLYSWLLPTPCASRDDRQTEDKADIPVSTLLMNLRVSAMWRCVIGSMATTGMLLSRGAKAAYMLLQAVYSVQGARGLVHSVKSVCGRNLALCHEQYG